jgi:hypothetical protein
MGIDLGIDTTSEYEEELRIEDIGGRVIVFRPPTSSQISAVSLELSGKRANEGAVRDFLEAVILSRAQVEERAYAPTPEDADEDYERELLDGELPAKLAEVLEGEHFADMDLIIDRMKDPSYNFGGAQLAKLTRYLMEQRVSFPTKPSSDSSSGRTTTGRSSTASTRRSASTPSRSRRVGS